ncbi:MAG: hypothetical protein IJA92_03605 [Oscillospiraceae bacterium]|nr:hypothetical protein [Oscillospiraceae bacterium]
MIYKAFYTAKRTAERDFDIMYRICEEKGDYYIESFICGGSFCEKAFLGRCGETKAEEFAKLLAKKAVHPVHIEDIISDRHF